MGHNIIAANGSRVPFGDFIGDRVTVVSRPPPQPALFASSDAAHAVEFLRTFDPDGRHNLVAIWPGGRVEGRTFEPGQWVEVADWTTERNHRANLYFSVNEPRAGAPHDKLTKEDIGAIRALFVDRDPRTDIPLQGARRELRDLGEMWQASPLPPTLQVDSGAGRHAYWVLADKLDPSTFTGWAETYGRGLAVMVSGDAVQNVDRIMRLPGTTNLPDAKKAARGRVPHPASVTHAGGRRYSPEEIAAQVAPIQSVEREADVSAALDAIDMSDLDVTPELAARFEASGIPGLDLWRGVKRTGDASRSGLMASLAETMARRGFGAQDFACVLSNWEYRPKDDGHRAMARAWARCGEPECPDRWFDEAADELLFPVEPAPEPVGLPAAEAISWVSPEQWAGVPIPPREWEVDGWIPRREVTLLYGDGGIGKTLLTHQYAVAAAAGIPWLGLRTRPARVMCFFCEDSQEELHRRHVDILQAAGLPFDATGGRLRLACRRFMDNLLALHNRTTGEMKLRAVWRQLRDDAVAFGADVVVLDTLADIYAGEEQDRSQVNTFVKSALGRLANDIGGSVIALGHPSKAGLSSGDGTSGSTAWSNAVRSRLYLRQHKGKGPTASSFRELESMKVNYGPRGSLLKLRWHRGAFEVVAGAVQPSSIAAGTAFPQLADMAQSAVVAALIECADVQMSLAPNSTRFAPRVLAQRAPDRLSALSEGDVRSALEALVASGAVRVDVVGRNASRHPVHGLVVDADKLSGGAAASPGLFD